MTPGLVLACLSMSFSSAAVRSGIQRFLVAGPFGAVVAAAAVFAPPYLIVLFGAPYCRRFAQDRQGEAFVQVTAAAVGVIAGAAFILARRSLVDISTLAIAVVTLGILIFTKKIPESIAIVAAGVVGVLLQGKMG
jgi:chromate transporter